MKTQRTLAIETSCDDTSVWIVSFDWNEFLLEELLAYSQVNEHNTFGGVVPEIASRLHSEKIIAVLNQIWRNKINKVDNISITTEPGLPWSLVVGKTVSSLLWEYFDKPVIPVNHILGHIFALFLERNIDEIPFPMALLTASGWHNNLYIVSKKTEWIVWKNNKLYCWNYTIEQIWQTLDDAAGECFDKVSRMLGWPYPWWVWISQQAKLGKANKEFELNRIWLSKQEFNFSFSWVKSQVNQIINKRKLEIWNNNEKQIFSDSEIKDISWEFQESIVEVLWKKLLRAAIKYWAKSVWLSGGVSANDRLQEYILELLDNKQWIENQKQNILDKNVEVNFENIKLFVPTKKIYCTDNAAMIWVAWILSQNNKNSKQRT